MGIAEQLEQLKREGKRLVGNDWRVVQDFTKLDGVHTYVQPGWRIRDVK